ncbi:MAG: thioredoxin family protein [Chloroflexota bacterium]
MAIAPERFEQGMTYGEYKLQMTRSREKFEQNEHEVTIDPMDLVAFQQLPQPLNVLVLAEDWCGDVIANLPVLGRLARESGKLNLRIFLRDQHPDLMDQFLKEGKYRSIPVFVFFDQDFRELGRFIERPDDISLMREQRRRELYVQHPEYGSPETPFDQIPEQTRGAIMQHMGTLRDELKPVQDKAVIRDLRAIVERARPRG